MKKPASPLAISLRQRLLNEARKRGVDFQEIFRQFMQQRLLYRISQSALEPDVILKGALLFTLWGGAPHRATRDVDLLGSGECSVARFTQVFLELCQLNIDPPDGVVWAEDSLLVEEVREDQHYHGLRIYLTGYLEAARQRLQIDLGFGDAVTPGPDLVTFPSLLEDRLPPPRLRAYPKETSIAEKTEVLVRLGLLNSRIKDVYDLWSLAMKFSFDGALVCQALAATFSRRLTSVPSAIPVALTPRFALDRAKQRQWQAFLLKSHVPLGTDLSEVVSLLQQFLWPPLEALAHQKPFGRSWSPAGPWQPPETSLHDTK